MISLLSKKKIMTFTAVWATVGIALAYMAFNYGWEEFFLIPFIGAASKIVVCVALPFALLLGLVNTRWIGEEELMLRSEEPDLSAQKKMYRPDWAINTQSR